MYSAQTTHVQIHTSLYVPALGNMRERVGSFNSSNVVLNGVYDAMVRTYEGLTTGGMSVDCPHR